MGGETNLVSTLVVVVTLLGPREVPVPLDFGSNDVLGDHARFSVREESSSDLGLVGGELGRSVRCGQGTLGVSLDSYV